MAYRVLGQVVPTPYVATDLYVVPPGLETVCSTIVACNRGVSSATYRIAVRPGGAALDDAHYIAYEVTLPAKDSDYHTIGITLQATDAITVHTFSPDLSFSAFGAEG